MAEQGFTARETRLEPTRTKRFLEPSKNDERFPDFICLDELEESYDEGLTTEQVIAEVNRLEPKANLTLTKFRYYGTRKLISASFREGRSGKHTGSYGLYPHCVVWQFLCIDFLTRVANYKINTLGESKTWQSIIFVQSQRWKGAQLLRDVVDKNTADSFSSTGSLKTKMEKVSKAATDLETNMRESEEVFVELMRAQFPFPRSS